tara:strand:- start:3695 stop:4312 length:618 start_codon:yes stop_codon:yes gene_type:complete
MTLTLYANGKIETSSGALELPNGLSHSSAPSGSSLQVVQGNCHNTANFASVDYQATGNSVAITPKLADSKFLIQAIEYGGVANHDCAVAFNFYDSQHQTSATTVIAPEADSGGVRNGASGGRMSSYFGITSWAGDSSVDNWFIGHSSGTYLYTPGYQSTTARTFTVCVKTSTGQNYRQGMNGQNNTTDPRDMRVYSSIMVTEIAA